MLLVDWICERGNLIIYYVTYIQILSFGEDKTQFMASINNIKIMEDFRFTTKEPLATNADTMDWFSNEHLC